MADIVTSQPIETPSGKDAEYENFPVGSWLLPAALRPHIATFYHFARAIDDIADHPDTPPPEKLSGLQLFEDALTGEVEDQSTLTTAINMKRSLSECGISPQHCLDLIAAFKQDSAKNRYQNWGELMDYCLLSAAPVGRYLIDLHGGSRNGYGASDALCSALQVINHLQDCQEDYRVLDRVYLPGDWMEATGIDVTELDQDQCSSSLRRVLDQALDATELLMFQARGLPGGVVSFRLAMESAVIIQIANRLITKLRENDPLAGRVKLSKPEYLWCSLKGVLSAAIGTRKM